MKDGSIDLRGETRPAPLTPDRAFVVQLRVGTSCAAAELSGRIEHVTSGRACLFESLEEARAFMEQVLAQRKAPADIPIHRNPRTEKP